LPVYKNNTSVPQRLTVKDENMGEIPPGVEYTTKYFTSNTNLSLVTETPYYNKVTAVTALTGLSGTAQTVNIVADTETIIVTQITGSVTVYRQAVANTPAQFVAYDNESPVVPINNDGTFNKLLFTGSGDVTVYQYRA